MQNQTTILGSKLFQFGPGPENPFPDLLQEIEVTLLLNPSNKSSKKPTMADFCTYPFYQFQLLAPKLYGTHFRTSLDDILLIRKVAASFDLKMVHENPYLNYVQIRGKAKNLGQLFGIEFFTKEWHRKQIRFYKGDVQVPQSISHIVFAVIGLDAIPLNYFITNALVYKQSQDFQYTAPHGAYSFKPPEVAQLYNFPKGDGEGQKIGFIQLGGGFLISDMEFYFRDFLDLPKMPNVKAISVGDASNAPGGWRDVGVCLDIQVAGSIAYGATINNYFAEPTTKGLFDAILLALEQENNVIIASPGSIDENLFTVNQRQAFNFLFQMAAMMGITILAGTGNWGSLGQRKNEDMTQAHVNFPASSPWVTACGGTSLHLSEETGIEFFEEVWNNTINGGQGATGGGVSNCFATPRYQIKSEIIPRSVNGPMCFRGRGIPDVAANANPYTSYRVNVNGLHVNAGGSRAAPSLWAALVAVLNARLGVSLGFLNPYLYLYLTKEGQDCFHDIKVGNNSFHFDNSVVPGYEAKAGWDPCSGFGSPNGVNIMNALQQIFDIPTPQPVTREWL